jgi:hypothetical protein
MIPHSRGKTRLRVSGGVLEVYRDPGSKPNNAIRYQFVINIFDFVLDLAIYLVM